MFGIKMKPAVLFSMLRNFGLSPEKLLPQLEAIVLKEWDNLEAQAGAPLSALAMLSDDRTHFIVSLYVQNKENGGLDLWRTFPLSDIALLLKNLENNNSDEYTPNAEIEPNSSKGITAPDQDRADGSESENNGHGTNTGTIGPDEYPAFQ